MKGYTVETNKIFVYGTLQEGGRLFVAYPELQEQFVKAERAVAVGCMYTIQDRFPAVTFNVPGYTVVGQVHEYRDMKEVLHLMDYIEGNGWMYNRIQVPVRTAGGDILVWAYEKGRELHQFNEIIPNGNWNEYNREITLRWETARRIREGQPC